jgi:mRNA interferase HigB
MRVVGKTLIEDYGISHSNARRPLGAWLRVAEQATWQNIMEVKQTYPHADYVKPYTIFDIKGNSYRLITIINYDSQLLSIERRMTHSEYNKGNWK